jgi:hypothetical protein
MFALYIFMTPTSHERKKEMKKNERRGKKQSRVVMIKRT